MNRNGLACMLAGATLISGCAQERTDTLTTLTGLLRSGEWDFPIIESTSGLYEGYFVETAVIENGLMKGEKKKMYSIWISDCQEGQIKARIHAETRFGADYPPQEFTISQDSKTIPQGHPFEHYTSQKIQGIYTTVTNHKK